MSKSKIIKKKIGKVDIIGVTKMFNDWYRENINNKYNHIDTYISDNIIHTFIEPPYKNTTISSLYISESGDNTYFETDDGKWFEFNVFNGNVVELLK